jgi:hypothetical protein
MEDLKSEVFRRSREKCFSIIFESVSADDFLCSLSKSFLKLAIGKPKLFRSVFVAPYSGSVGLFGHVMEKYALDDIFGAQGRMYDLKGEDVRQIFDKVYYFTLGYAVTLISEGKNEFTQDVSDFTDRTVRELVSSFFLSLGY